MPWFTNPGSQHRSCRSSVEDNGPSASNKDLRDLARLRAEILDHLPKFLSRGNLLYNTVIPAGAKAVIETGSFHSRMSTPTRLP